MKKYLAYILIAAGISVFVFVLYSNSRYNGYTRTFSPYTLLQSSWERYKVQFLSNDGRIVDHSSKGVTTSEGQSYALLRSVWLDDRETFDKVWTFTKNNMKRKDDNLFGWKWGKIKENTYGLLPDGGDGSASDADSDIALALILAGDRWSDSRYIDQAKVILKDMWNIETVEVGGKRYLVAGNWTGKAGEDVVINPSYFAPYAWRIFARVDTDHDWKSLIDPAYDLLAGASRQQLDTSQSAGLPPDWLLLTKEGTLKQAPINGFTTNYSYDAVRVPWRVALDYQWNREARAYEYLKSFEFLADQYVKNGYKLPSSYTHDGKVIEQFESPTMYSTVLAYFSVMKPDLAKKVYQEKIITLYSTDKNSFQDTLPYYDLNWLWFGAALYNEKLVAY
jgi:endoglucanase